MFDDGKYNEVADVLDSFDVSDFHDEQAPVTLMCFSNGIDPLMRKIPEKDRLDKLHLARVKFYDKCKEYYKDHKDGGAILKGLEPENYVENISFYKSIGMNI